MSKDLDRVVKGLDSLRRTANNGVEYWMARDIQPHLGYSTWESFSNAMDRAKTACESASVSVRNHFRDITKEIAKAGKGATTERADCYLSRYACYLIAMNGDARKPEIAVAQTYFAVQTRRQEISEEREALEKTVAVRERVSVAVKSLNIVAKDAGVQKYGLFHDAGYRGLYGMGLSEIKRKKNLPSNENLYDHAGRTELAANEFRLTQTRDKLKSDNIKEERHAIALHKAVGEEVRAAIKKIGGVMPEDLAAEPSLKKLTASPKKKLIKPSFPTGS